MHRNKSMKPGQKLPDDAILIEERGSWELHYSVSEQALLVKTNDYHPGILKLTELDLRHFADKMSKVSC